MNTTARLYLATRLHFALLRHFDENVAIVTLLADGPDGREALWVCEASGNVELMSLAREYLLATRVETQARG